jgi:hypothetical protein
MSLDLSILTTAFPHRKRNKKENSSNDFLHRAEAKEGKSSNPQAEVILLREAIEAVEENPSASKVTLLFYFDLNQGTIDLMFYFWNFWVDDRGICRKCPATRSLGIIVPAGTPKKGRRMSNVLDAILRPMKMVMPSPSKISKDKAEELKMTIDEAAPPVFARAGPSESKLLEQESKSLPERIALPIPEATSLGDLRYCWGLLGPCFIAEGPAGRNNFG